MTDIETETLGDDAVEGGNYEVIRARLTTAGQALREAADTLNTGRQETFGSTELAILGNERVRTENNCVPRDIVQVGGHLLFGYNVFLGLKKQTTPDDVLSVQVFERSDEGFAFHAAPEGLGSLLTDAAFRREFDELVQYYKDARLVQLRVTDSKLLAVFRTGATVHDVKVLRWAVDPVGAVTYIDSRGERDHVFPPTHDFEWTPTTRADHVLGRHPHVNVLDEVFVETVGGDLTVKVEDNTEDGQGIYSEPVDDSDQSLDDAEIAYARRGQLVLLRITPYGETRARYLVFNTATRRVKRIDAIGASAASLPEDHGIIFPGGYVLRTGESRVFDDRVAGLRFVRAIASPNGEDVLYVFHRADDGLYALYPYNLIRKEVATPITAHGYSLFDDGTLIVFRATDEPTRVHPMQIWATPFVSALHHDPSAAGTGVLARIGNADLVRGISDALTLVRMVDEQQPTRQVYEALISACTRFVDAYHWIGDAEVGDLRALVETLRRTAELIVDEFDKVVALRQRAAEVVAQARRDHERLLLDVRPDDFDRVDDFLEAMTRLRAHRGHLITLQEVRYVDHDALTDLEQATVEQFDSVSHQTVEFLLGEAAFVPLTKDLDVLLGEARDRERAADLAPLTERLHAITSGVNLLGEVVAGLTVDDPTVKTTLLEGISEVVAHANRARAVLEGRRRTLMSTEGQAEFAARFKLYGQSVASALALCDSPPACDDQLSRLLLLLEELEARFSEFDAFLPQLAEKREEVYEAFTGRKQILLEARQRRVGSVWAAVERILGGISRRAGSFDDEDALNSWFAADPMVLKLRSLADELTALHDTVKADELASRLKAAKQDALRGLRDQRDLFEEGADLLKLGKHRFTVNRQALELTLVPHGDGDLAVHLTGTDFLEPVNDEAFARTRPFWDQVVASEDPTTARAEYLAACLLDDAEHGRGGWSVDRLERVALDPAQLLEAVRDYAADRYDEGYDRGIHDRDAARILTELVALRRTAGLLRFGSAPRALAMMFRAHAPDLPVDAWVARARALAGLRDHLGPSDALTRLADELADRIAGWSRANGLAVDADALAPSAGRYLLEVFASDPRRFAVSQPAEALREGLNRWLEAHGGQSRFEDRLRPLEGRPAEQLDVVWAWTRSFAELHHDDPDGSDPATALEAAAWMLGARHVDADVLGGGSHVTITGLLAQHPRIADGAMPLQLADFLERTARFRTHTVPGYRAYRAARHALLVAERERLRIDEFQPRVMSTFVRNRLINDVLLPIVGDNLAKQLGAAGDATRTDRMGLLLLVSPPGYGKTTLMEYVASRLGLTFMKVNGPALGHEVTSLDPDDAPNATARQEVDKINLALEMGNNVMLYLDDIQHCHPELLQKFISLCDGQRRIEGVWSGRTRTYDLRGKKLCVVMAGNPYTESGDRFQIPDMLANRADTYNLGDILGSASDAFALSFIENALTSNAALAPLAARGQDDLYLLVRKAKGHDVATSALSHDYSAIELAEIDAVLKHLFQAQEVLLAVNATYIASAATEDAYRTEPRFQLQGSYRNMNKIAEKVVPAMTTDEVDRLISDHYRSEAQTLTTGAEANLLKLAELRGRLTPDEEARWEAIRTEFARRRLMGADEDPAARITGVLATMTGHLERLTTTPVQDAVQGLTRSVDRVARASAGPPVDLGPVLHELRAIRAELAALEPAAPPPTPENGNGHHGLDDAREVLLRQARAALDGGGGDPSVLGNRTLVAALSVIETLTVQMASVARERLPPDEHDDFVEDLRRTVATAVSDLAS